MRCFSPIINQKILTPAGVFAFNQYRCKDGFDLKKTGVDHPVLLRKKGADIGYQNGLPCQTCPACRFNKKNEWLFRIQKELKYTTNNLFITLTYNNNHIKTRPIYDFQLNKVREQSVLDYSDFQKFIKRLRVNIARKSKNYDEKKPLKYIVVSEYGALHGRVHGHAIVMNCNIDDLLPWNVKKGNYTSKMLTESGGKGFLNIQKVNDNNINYLLKYIQKGVYANPADQEDGLAIDRRRRYLRRMINGAEKRLIIRQKKRLIKGCNFAYTVKKTIDWNASVLCAKNRLTPYEVDMLKKELDKLEESYLQRPVFHASYGLGKIGFLSFIDDLYKGITPFFRVKKKLIKTRLPYYFVRLFNRLYPLRFEIWMLKNGEKAKKGVVEKVERMNESRRSWSAELADQAVLLSRLTGAPPVEVAVKNGEEYKKCVIC